eukprot:CFRG5317T1
MPTPKTDVKKKNGGKKNENTNKHGETAQGLAKDALVAKDDRFKTMHHDPRFRAPRKQDQKLKVDDRFKGMLSEDRFKLNHKVDKYGRKEKHTTKDKLNKFYNIEGSEDESDELAGTKIAEYDPSRGVGIVSSSEESDSEDDTEALKKARKRMGLATRESDNESESEEESDVERIDDDDQTTRFAVQGMDWDFVRAVDLLCILESFKPATGIVKSVKVFPSEFGKARMAKEDIAGPNAYDGELDEEEDRDTVAEEVLRKYQLDRLKYYYAVVECDCVETARVIYKECDGQEFLNSGCFMDLRFVPDDMEFDEEPAQLATMVPSNYEPREFVNSAQQQSKISLTWDQNDPDRAVTLHTAVTEDQLEEMDYKNFLASGSSDEESGDDSDGETAKKYSDLIAGLKASEKQKNDDVDMEITFAPGLENTAKNILKDKEKRDASTKLGVWDQYLQKKKEKKKAKASGKEEMLVGDDDDVAVDRNDPFFNDADFGSDFEEPEHGNKQKTKAVSGNNKTKKSDSTKSSLADAEMDLLLLGDDVSQTGKDHFDMKDIIKQEKAKGKKRKGKKGAPEVTPDTFKVDVGDDRFQALYKSAEYAIDPTDARYKPTNAMKTIMGERQKRREDFTQGESEESTKKVKTSTSTKSLVDSIKRTALKNEINKSAGKRNTKAP